MSGVLVDPDSARAEATADVVAMAIAADRLSRARRSAQGADYLRPADHRLTDRMRHAVDTALREALTEAERTLRHRAQRMLIADGRPDLAASIGMAPNERDPAALAAVLPDLASQLAVRAALAQRAEMLPIHGADDPDEPGFLAALSQSEDPRIAAAARALMLADPLDGSAGRPSADMRAAIGWWLAGTIERELGTGSVQDRLALRTALVSAARATSDPADTVPDAPTAADRLVEAIDPRPGEIPFLLIEALRDRRLLLFCAIVGRATGLLTERLLPIMVSADDDRLWIVLRAAGLDRAAMAMTLSVLAATDAPADALVRADALANAAAMPVEQAAALALPLGCPDIHADALAGAGVGNAAA